MNFPLYMKDAFDYPTAMALGTLLGFLFGFVLERAGFGRSTVLAAQFYGRDMRVLKVMFSAIVTATIGLGLLGGLGAVDLGALLIPETFLGPAIVGGLLLGVGFIVSGYCPGTAVVSTASGNVDAVVSLIGVALGSLLFAGVYPAIEGFYVSGSLGALTLPQLFDLPWTVIALGVALMAVGAFAFAEWVEGWIAKRAHASAPESPRTLRRGVFAGMAAGAAVSMLTLLLPAGGDEAVAQTSPRTETIEPLALAKQLVGATNDLYVLDLRAPEACAEARVPGALCMAADDPEAKMLADFPTTRALVVYDADGTGDLPAGVEAFGGRVMRLAGGYANFEAELLTAPVVPTEATAEAISEYRLKAALHARFTGQEAKPAPMVRPKAVKRVVKKGGGC